MKTASTESIQGTAAPVGANHQQGPRVDGSSEQVPMKGVGCSAWLGDSAPDADLGRAINRLLLVRGAIGVSAAEIVEVVYRELGDWTVKAADYDRLHVASRGLLSACKHRLPPGTLWVIEPEIDRLDGVLSPNTEARQRGQ